MKKMGTGTKKSEGKTWHSQLSDKAAPLRNHLLWCICHCDGNANKLRYLLDSVLGHFQNKHDTCHASSPCKILGNRYVPHLTIVNDPVAISLMTNSQIPFFCGTPYIHIGICWYTKFLVILFIDTKIHFLQTDLDPLNKNNFHIQSN